MKILLFLLLLLLPLSKSAAAGVRLLSEFYPHLDQAASVLKAQADLEAERSNLLAQESLKGWELFGSVSGGYQRSPFAREPFGHFFDPMARIGVRYPLLGSAERRQRAVEDAAADRRYPAGLEQTPGGIVHRRKLCGLLECPKNAGVDRCLYTLAK